MLLGIFLLSSVSAFGDIGTVKQGDCIELYNYCPTCTYINLTAIQYPDRLETMNLGMTKDGTNYNYTFCDTELLEDYSNMNLEQLMEKRDKEQLELRYKYYSRVDFLSKKVIKLEDKLKILEEVVLKFIDDNTDARTSFKRWFKRKGEQQK